MQKFLNLMTAVLVVSMLLIFVAFAIVSIDLWAIATITGLVSLGGAIYARVCLNRELADEPTSPLEYE